MVFHGITKTNGKSMPYKPLKKFPSELEKKTLELYTKLPRNIKDIEIAQSTGLSSTWITTFVKGRAKFIDAGRLEALYAFCNGKPLEL